MYRAWVFDVLFAFRRSTRPFSAILEWVAGQARPRRLRGFEQGNCQAQIRRDWQTEAAAIATRLNRMRHFRQLNDRSCTSGDLRLSKPLPSCCHRTTAGPPEKATMLWWKHGPCRPRACHPTTIAREPLEVTMRPDFPATGATALLADCHNTFPNHLCQGRSKPLRANYRTRIRTSSGRCL
jgi:hypothetical protein